jgi:hypothetical protein
MKYKHRILEIFKDSPEDILAMTVAELIEKFSKEIEADKKATLKANNSIIENFTGVYIKVREDDGTFGLEVDYIRIDEIKAGSMDTDWNQLYNIKGEKVQFCNINNALVELNFKCQNSMSADELMGAEVIAKEDYEHAKLQLEKVNEIIEKVKL